MAAVVLLSSGMMAISACTVGPNYQRPVVTVPEQWRNDAKTSAAGAGAAGVAGAAGAAGAADAAQASAVSLADQDWWALFRDEQLQALIREALAGNKDLMLAAARVQEVRALLGVTRADQFPEVTAGVGATRNRASAKTAIPRGPTSASNDFNVGGDLSFELDLWGRLRRATESARASYLASEEARYAVRLALVRSVAQVYFELRDLDSQLEVAVRARDTRDASLKLATARRRGGLTSDLDVQQATAELASSRAVMANLDLQITQKENALNLLLGRDPGNVTRGVTLAAQQLPPDVPAGLPSALLERRPDIRQAEQELVSANAQIGVAKAAFFPRIALTGSLGFESAELSELLTRSAGLWSLSGNLAAPIFNAGRNRHNLEAAKARHEQAVVAYARAVQQAFHEVENTLVAYRKTREVQDAQEAQVAAATESLRLAEVRYRGGISTYLDVLDSQRQLLAAELQLSQTRRAHLVSLVQLYGALGGGWKA
jgi:multidrug efflux system outer membrane protein